MRATDLEEPSLTEMMPVDRPAARTSESELVRIAPLRPQGGAPMMVEPSLPGLDLAGWAESHRELVDRLFAEHRAVLFRGFDVRTVEQFQGFVAASSHGEPLAYRRRSAPRYTAGRGAFASHIHLHNEGTYWRVWAQKIYFCSLQVAAEGGATPISDVRAVYRRIDPAARRRFEEKEVLYVRNYDDGFGLAWQDVFQTESRDEVEDYCRKNQIELEWKAAGRLRTRQRRPVVRRHPQTGEPVWFNHAAFFHVTSLEPSVAAMLLSDFGEDELPYNTYYGDGTPIEPEVIAAIRDAYRQEEIVFPWCEGDVLLLDNMCFAHGREPYRGERQVVVAMTEPCSGEG